MKKFFALFLTFLVCGLPVANATYLVTDKNYYTDSSIKKGFLDEVINASTLYPEYPTYYQEFLKSAAK